MFNHETQKGIYFYNYINETNYKANIGNIEEAFKYCGGGAGA